MTLPTKATFGIAVRLTLASMLAMTAASAVGLSNPWWAGMAVWMIGQPPRGLLLERSLAQLVGAILGAAAGAIIVAGGGTPAVALLLLAGWIAACCSIASAMRHQRAYGAALCGLTSAVVVSLTLGTAIDPFAFATVRVLDNFIGIAAAIAIAVFFGPPAPASAVIERARSITAQAFKLISDALVKGGDPAFTEERAFLIALASLEASVEDAAAGSIVARRKLRQINTHFSYLLDLLVIARAIRARDGFPGAFQGSELEVLRTAFTDATRTIADDGVIDTTAINVACTALQVADPLLTPVLQEMRTLLERVATGYKGLSIDTPEIDTASKYHPDFAGVRLAALRGLIVTMLAATAWIAIGWEPLRYLVLGATVFTVLLSAVDEPASIIRQIFLGGAAAAVLATFWRLALLPELASPWLSLLLITPFVFGASLVQVRRGTLFLGLAFNMLFAVLARPVDTAPNVAPVFIANETMLLIGIAASYAFYRWLVPMNTGRRRKHLEASIRREIAALAIRPTSPWGTRHLARLRYLVFSLAAKSGGEIQVAENALAALTLGHVIFRLKELSEAPGTPVRPASILRAYLRLYTAPALPTFDICNNFGRDMADAILSEPSSDAKGQADAARIIWLMDFAKRESGHSQSPQIA